MSKPSERKRQKHDKRRALARQRAKEHELPQSYGDLIRFASARPFGPAWVSVGYDDEGAEGIPLLTVIVTRKLPGALLLAACALVDRTCLGIKNAYVMEPAAEPETARRVAHVGEQQREALRPCDPELAQSIVFHALDYARSLGFAPHDDFEASLFGPRPAALAPTRWARPERPCYVSGPDDDVRAILRQLDLAVGSGGYEFVRGLDDENDEGWLPDHDDDHGSHDWDDSEDWDEDAVERAIEMLRARRSDVRHAGNGEAIDWRAACDGVRCEHVLSGLKLDLSGDAPPPAQSALDEAVREIVDMLEHGEYLAWEAAIRAEQGLTLLPAHRRALGRFCWFDDEDDDTVILAIDDHPRPSEPWYETVRTLARHLVVERFVTSAVHYDGEITRGADLLRAIEAHAGELSLPPGCTNVCEILPPAVWHRLKLQPIFDTLSGLGYRWHDGRVASLTEHDGTGRIDAFAAGLDEHAESLAALGWRIDDLLARVELPPNDRARLVDALDRRGRGGA